METGVLLRRGVVGRPPAVGREMWDAVGRGLGGRSIVRVRVSVSEYAWLQHTATQQNYAM